MKRVLRNSFFNILSDLIHVAVVHVLEVVQVAADLETDLVLETVTHVHVQSRIHDQNLVRNRKPKNWFQH